jgi:hypothetical protein
MKLPAIRLRAGEVQVNTINQHGICIFQLFKINMKKLVLQPMGLDVGYMYMLQVIGWNN